MQNKFTAAGIAMTALIDQKRFVIVSPTHREVRDTLASFEQVDFISDQARFSRTNGSEKISFGDRSSEILLRSARQSLRGYLADVIFVEEDVVRHYLSDAEWIRWRREVEPILLSRGAELVIG